MTCWKKLLENWLTILFLILILDTTILGSQGIPIPDSTGDGHESTRFLTTAKYDTVSLQGQGLVTHTRKNEVKKLRKHDIFNSYLCGAGYIYNSKMATCEFARQGRKYPSAEEFDPETTTPIDRSVETLEYSSENLSKLGNGLLPLECGMNYRYLKIAKICKPINAPKSSESHENAKDDSSEKK